MSNNWLNQDFIQRWEWLPFYNMRSIQDKIILTNRAGDWDILTQEEFNQINKPLVSRIMIERLAESNLILYNNNQDSVLETWKAFNNNIDQNGPQLHIIHLTRRCNLGCSYCHSAAIPLDKKNQDLNNSNALYIADFIIDSPSEFVSINFQGGEPTLMPGLIKTIMDKLLKSNKKIKASITTNGTNLNDEVVQILKEYKISISISIDGPREIHDKIRIDREGNGSYDKVIEAREFIKNTEGLKYSGSIMVLSKDTISNVKGIIDEYVANKQRYVHLKPVTKLGFGKSYWNDLGVDFETYWKYYIEGIEYMLSLQEKGITIMELQMKFALQMLIERTKPNYVDFRNPCGLVYGVLNYDIDGKIYGCHEGKRKKEFLLGDSATANAIELLNSEKANNLASSSVLDKNEECQKCAYLPYCSPCPANTLQMTGTTEIKPYEDFHCKFTLHLFDWLFDKLENDPDKIMGWWRNEVIELILTENKN